MRQVRGLLEDAKLYGGGIGGSRSGVGGWGGGDFVLQELVPLAPVLRVALVRLSGLVCVCVCVCMHIFIYIYKNPP
jgi:hypothetical protein